LNLLLQLIHNFQRNKTNLHGINQLVGPEYLVEIEFTAVVSENEFIYKVFILLNSPFIKVMNITLQKYCWARSNGFSLVF
jgi:hypothetical protein